jgi:hypothetical protein
MVLNPVAVYRSQISWNECPQRHECGALVGQAAVMILLLLKERYSYLSEIFRSDAGSLQIIRMTGARKMMRIPCLAAERAERFTALAPHPSILS